MKFSDIKSVFLPHGYVNNKSKSIKTVGLLLLFAYILAFSGMTYAVSSFLGSVYEDLSQFVLSADDFSLVDDVFTFTGEENSCYVESIDSYIAVDTSKSYKDLKGTLGGKEYLVSAVIASDGFGVAFGGEDTWLSITELYAMTGRFTFTKALVEEYIGDGQNILSNLVVSVSIFVAVVLLPVFAVLILLVTLIARMARRFTGADLNFAQLLFVSCGSFVYPLLVTAVLSLFPNSVLFTAVYLLDILRLMTAAVFFYLLLVFYPFFAKRTA